MLNKIKNRGKYCFKYLDRYNEGAIIWRQNESRISAFTVYLVFTFTYYHLFPFAINLRRLLVANNSRTYECSAKLCSYITTGKVFQIALRVGGIPHNGRNRKFCWGEFFFSLVTNSSLKLKMNICILPLSIFFPKIYYFYTTYK